MSQVDENIETFSCSLCLDFYSDNGEDDYFVSTECGHIFHYLCLKPAHDSGFKACPICRTDLDLSTLRKLYGLATKRKPCKFQFDPPPPKIVPPKDADYRFKIILVGDSGVGKSSLLQRYADGTYNSRLFSTIGCDWRCKVINVGGKVINMSIWDTVGQERHRSLITNYVRDAHGALICYDITNRDSFSEIEYWFSFVEDHGLENCVKILVGNKSDLDDIRTVPKSEGKALAQKLKLPFFETSAKDEYQVEVTFRTLAAKILETDSLIKDIEYKKKGTLRLSRNQVTNPSGLETFCSYSWHWTKSGLAGAAKSVKSRWNSITS